MGVLGLGPSTSPAHEQQVPLTAEPSLLPPVFTFDFPDLWYSAVLCIEIAFTESVLPREHAHSGGWRSAIFSDCTGCQAGFRSITFAFYFLQELVYFTF